MNIYCGSCQALLCVALGYQDQEPDINLDSETLQTILCPNCFDEYNRPDEDCFW